MGVAEDSATNEVTLVSRFLQDRERDDAQSFGFALYSDALAATITDPVLNTPFAIAIYGGWGTGKTSLMKTVAKKIGSSKEFKCKTIWFNAWKYEVSSQPIWASFLSVVLSEISELIGEPESKKKVATIGTKIVTLAAQAILNKFAGIELEDLKQIVSDMQSQVTEIQTLSDQMNSAVEIALSKDKKKRRRIVIFIDDLDRCLPDKVVDLFESMKLFLDCEHCVFVMGFDRTQIVQAFDRRLGLEKGQSIGSKYLEKFVQLEFELPPKIPPQVEDFVKSVAPSQLRDDKMIMSIISRFIEPNPRKILRWLNRVAFIQELFRAGLGRAESAPETAIPRIVPVWIFIKSFFPEFAVHVENDQVIFELAIKRATGRASQGELEEIKGLTIDKDLERFLKSLNPSLALDPRLPEVIFQTKLTITESVSRLQPASVIQEIDTLDTESVDALVDELIETTEGKMIEVARLIGEQLAAVRTSSDYKAAANRIRFLKRVASNVTSENLRSALFDILMGIVVSGTDNLSSWDFGEELKKLLENTNLQIEALKKGYVDIYVSRLSKSHQWEYAGQFSEILLIFVDNLNDDQANRIALASFMNDQVYNSYRARPTLGRILKSTRGKIQTDIWSQLVAKMGVALGIS